FSSRRRHTRWPRDWSSDVCSSDLIWRVQRVFVLVIYGFSRPHGRIESNIIKQRKWSHWVPAAQLHSRIDIIASGLTIFQHTNSRSEERRVGKECRSRLAREH